YAGVGAAHLQVDLGAAELPELHLGFLHHAPPDPPSLEIGRNSQIVDPAAVPVVAGHHAGDDTTAGRADEQQVRLDLLLPLDVSARVVGGHDELTAAPEIHHLILVRGLIGPHDYIY